MRIRTLPLAKVFFVKLFHCLSGGSKSAWEVSDSVNKVFSTKVTNDPLPTPTNLTRSDGTSQPESRFRDGVIIHNFAD